MKLLYISILFIAFVSTKSMAQKEDHAEFSLDSGESIQVEDASAMDSIDSTDFDKAFKDSKVKKRKRHVTKKVKYKKKRSVKSDSLKSTNGNRKVNRMSGGKKKKIINHPVKVGHLSRVFQAVKVEYSKAKIKVWSFARKLKKKWNLSK